MLLAFPIHPNIEKTDCTDSSRSTSIRARFVHALRCLNDRVPVRHVSAGYLDEAVGRSAAFAFVPSVQAGSI